ncbi:MAG: amidohydrolase family protein [Saprospiraceae bacterium]|nr:amidohydrolase family protein [Saprospiraceae bacterium]
MRKISADFVYTIDENPIENGVVIVNNSGKVLGVDIRSNHQKSELEIYEGIIIPGFVNTHCHLELSHMKGKVDTGTGLIPFITEVVQQRSSDEQVIHEAIVVAEREMLDAGIVAVGDISNVIDTFAVKAENKLRYSTFIEFFDFLQNTNAQSEFKKYKEVYEKLNLPSGHKKSCVPHAPYSVSANLFELINEVNLEFNSTISIHNQETVPENQLFLDKSGDFIDFYSRFGISLNDFEPNKKPSIHYALQHMNPRLKTLFVHNTISTSEDIQVAQTWGSDVFWATCPNANLYIENNLPDYKAFIDNDAQMTIGTDSLTSNWQLSILEEMKTIAKYQSYVPFQTLLQWATLNGARALGFDDELGSITIGKTCGLNLLYNLNHKGELGPATQVKRLI